MNQTLLIICACLLVILIGTILLFVRDNNKISKKPKSDNEIVFPHLVNTIMNMKYPISVQFIHTNPNIVLLRNFLSPEECDYLIQRAQESGMKRSTVVSSKMKQEISTDRTSYTTNLKKNQNQIIQDIEHRASLITNNHPDTIEPLQVVRYEKGQQYKPHYDFFVPGAAGTKEAIEKSGQRTSTLFVYLNDLLPNEMSGHTEFPKLNLKIKPERGMAVWWQNIDKNGNLDYNTLHAGNPPDFSTKWGANIWFRERLYR